MKAKKPTWSKSCDYGYFFDNLHFFSQRMVVDVIMLHEFSFFLALGLPDPQIPKSVFFHVFSQLSEMSSPIFGHILASQFLLLIIQTTDYTYY